MLVQSLLFQGGQRSFGEPFGPVGKSQLYNPLGLVGPPTQSLTPPLSGLNGSSSNLSLGPTLASRLVSGPAGPGQGDKFPTMRNGGLGMAGFGQAGGSNLFPSHNSSHPNVGMQRK